MRLFDRSASKLAAGPTLALSADPGPALFDQARRYDPGLRYSSLLRRLIFSNGVLLLGPVKVTPGVAQQAGLPEGTVVAWLALAALQGHQDRRVHDAKAFDGERLVRRRGMTREQARARMAAQASRKQRLAIADIVIDNCGSLAELDRQVGDLWTQLRRRAAESGP